MKLFVEYLDDKFINNILLTNITSDTKILSSDINNDIYRFHDKYNFDTYIFNANKAIVNKEILQFIKEYKDSLKIILYHTDNSLLDILSKNSLNVKHIGYADIEHDSYIKIPQLLNRNLFLNKNFSNRFNKIACFVNDKLPDDLLGLLYPNTKLPIVLFGNIVHPQSIGKVTEQEKSFILNTYEYYLSLDNNYINEASECGCKIFTTQSILESKAMIDIDTKNILSYSEFLNQVTKR